MKTKLLDLLGFILFILFFILISPVLIVSGAILRPFRYFKYIKSKVDEREPDKYWY